MDMDALSSATGTAIGAGGAAADGSAGGDSGRSVGAGGGDDVLSGGEYHTGGVFESEILLTQQSAVREQRFSYLDVEHTRQSL